jgi:acetate kinase
MNGLDAIVFTAGIGENSSLIRKLVCSDLDYFGISLDQEKNKHKIKSLQLLNKPNAKVSILVVPTNEELEIAKQAYNLVN